MNRPFLKWAGGKYQSLKYILPHLPKGKRFVEPFVGSGTVFLNTHYSSYLLADANQDLINLFLILREEGEKFIDYCRRFFRTDTNLEKKYYKFREEFNATDDLRRKSALFIYLNRHGYNGLCRYNSSGGFNVPFGKYRGPKLPVDMLKFFREKTLNAHIVHQDFLQTMSQAKKGDVIYCDPPYVPLSKTALFSAYHAFSFTEQEQQQLADAAKAATKKGISVIISNHDTPFTREIYSGAHLESFNISRTINSNVDARKGVLELIAVFS